MLKSKIATATVSNESVSGSLHDFLNIEPVSYYVEAELQEQASSSIGVLCDLRPKNATAIIYNPWDLDSVMSAALLVSVLKTRHNVVVMGSDKITDVRFKEYVWVGVDKAKTTLRKDMFVNGSHVFLKKPDTQMGHNVQESIYSGIIRKYGKVTSVSDTICNGIVRFYRSKMDQDLTKEQLVTLWSNYRTAIGVLHSNMQLRLTHSPRYMTEYVEQEPTKTAVHSWESAMQMLRNEMQGSIVRDRIMTTKGAINSNLTNWGTMHYPWKARFIRLMDTPHVNYQFTPAGVVIDSNLANIKIEGFMSHINVAHSYEV